MLRPRSRLQGVNGGQDDGDSGPLCEEQDGTHDAGCILDRMQPQRPVETGHATDHNRRPPPSNGPRGGATPRKPEVSARPRSRQQRNRRLSATDAGKTVVVLASVPRVAREARPTRTLLPGTAGAALLGSPSKEAVKVLPDQTVLPWPLGRRCW